MKLHELQKSRIIEHLKSFTQNDIMFFPKNLKIAGIKCRNKSLKQIITGKKSRKYLHFFRDI